MKNPTKKSIWKSLRVGLFALLGMVIFAYSFQVTKVDLEDFRSEQRQESRVRVIRALAHPDLFKYDQAVEVINAPVYVPCPENLPERPSPENTGLSPYVIVTPSCAAVGETVRVEGFNFAPETVGPVRFVPGSDPENPVALGRDNAKTDSSGHFVVELVLPNRLSDEVQYIRATLSRNVGSPYLTKSALETWDKIIETVFLALLATVLGTLFAVPLSFIAARNLMKSVKSPLASIALSVLGWPIGIFVGLLLFNWVGTISAQTSSNMVINLISIIIIPVLVNFGVRWAVPEEEIELPAKSTQYLRLVALFVVVMIAFYGLFQLGNLAMIFGAYLRSALGPLGFLGYFLFQIGDILIIITAGVGALAAGATLSNFLGRIGQTATEKLPVAALKTTNLILAALAGATVFGLIGQLIDWLYQIQNPTYIIWGPILAGAAAGLLLASLTKTKESLPIGIVIYTITRTLLNALRSVEALVMAIVFVIAVGIGPFAGMMALGLHTIVSLAKLYSEQVESISSGPLEAIEATGANRLQTIIYAVIPQIIPPYISYTMYRWDINVRMSTIIGFVGGGGIGFLLQQNINLLNYRAASVQMLAIAVVVSLMDYVSSELRERVV
ncbi:MAG: ABC transporter permease subunit [Anaerolineales bacterium]|jgi:phosphonate ABC transporter permease subunit PhnE|nr:ABC transporter permease subunit [Anaerolineales bacterium]